MPRPLSKYSPITFVILFSVCAYALADNSVLSPKDFLSQVWDVVQSMGGLHWAMKVSAIIVLVIASLKVSFLNDLIWSKLGELKAWIAPVLGIVSGVLLLLAQGQLSLPGVFAYFSAGVGALALHELLDTIKSVKGIGPVYVGLIDAIEKALGGPASQGAK